MRRTGVVRRRALRCVAVALLSGGLSSCYVVSQGWHLIGHQMRAEPIESIEGHAEFFTTVRSIRTFARDELCLADTDNYTRFVDVEGNYLVTVVSATREDSFVRKEWWFPFFGSFPYKGFYRESPARRLAHRLDDNGYDVFVRRVDAFSTLGYFRDPLYSFMTGYDPFRLASLLIHEQTHATLFLKDAVQFNEELATFVGYHGALAYLESVYGSQSPEYFEASVYWEELETFLAEIRALHARLSALYESADRGVRRGETETTPHTGGRATRAGAKGLEASPRNGGALAAGREAASSEASPADAVDSRVRILERKAKIIEGFQADFERRYDESFATDRFRWFADYPVNNAVIDVYMKYTGDLSLFEELYEAVGRSIPRLLEALMPLEGTGNDPKGYMKSLILDEADQS